MVGCKHCGVPLTQNQIRNGGKYCSRQCFVHSHYGERVEWNGVQIRPGKTLEVLKLCSAGVSLQAACQMVGAHENVLTRLPKTPDTAALFSWRKCLFCGESLPLPLQRKYCSAKCSRSAKYDKQLAAEGRERRQIDYERHNTARDLYRRGLGLSDIARHMGVKKDLVKHWIYRFGVEKPSEICQSVMSLRPTRHQLEDAQTADEWAEILRGSVRPPERSDRVILVCARLHGSGAPGRYVSIAAEQYWHEDFSGGSLVAFCNILKNAITTIEWHGELFHLTRTFKTSGTFVWPDEKLGRSIEVTRAEFDHLISLKKQSKNAEKACIHAGFMIQLKHEKQP